MLFWLSLIPFITMVLAEQIRLTVARGTIHRAGAAEQIGAVSISIGVAEWLPADPTESLIGRADAALYKCKVGGRNRITAATSGQRWVAARRTAYFLIGSIRALVFARTRRRAQACNRVP